MLWLAALSAMIMTAWDVVVDPTWSGVMQAWTWAQGGERVPLGRGVPPAHASAGSQE